ncbi:DUF1501 domain-containing protein [Lentisphaera profundi]|uniref:DUF1501 domain-containing protein n=1 Tax=Lentisphaera profundi TaxID=1658616 RepID=A0ABY7VXQ1_9BACT|nr:DUF1501 domain-containing protein [Lentisphaera profundi]WDE97571.1 DUF1501 domain-containing protein [Lentisphaera profundi]
MNFDRRDFFRYSTGALCGFSPLANSLQAQPRQLKQNAKMVIYVNVSGGLSQLDSFGIKADNKEISGQSKAIKSSADGIRISHFFPRMAKQMHHVALINSMHTNQGAHAEGDYYTHTSYVPRSSIIHPELGAWVSRFKGDSRMTLPAFVKISATASSGAGFFEGKYGALPIAKASSGLQYSSRHRHVDKKQFDQRLQMLSLLNKTYSKKRSHKMVETYSAAYDNAVRLMGSKDLDVFDINNEKKKYLDAYGNNDFGQGCLLARRLAESGVKFIEVKSNAWDHHNGIYEDFPKQAAELDQGLAALIHDLSQRGMLNSTLVVLSTEFGRTPDLSPGKGRGHYPKAYTCLLAGGGISGGQAYGKVSADGRDIEENKVSVPDFNATIAYAAGLDVKKVITSPEGRPFTVAHKGKPLYQLF